MKPGKRLPYGQKFSITAFDVSITLGMPFGGRQIIQIAKSSVDEEYDKANGEYKATDGSKPKVTPKTKPKPHAKKVVLAEKDYEKHLEEVDRSAAMRKRQPEKLPLLYYSPYAIRLTKLDNELSEDEVVISEYIFCNVKMWMRGDICNQSVHDK
ncbi:hypothetical protein Cgig2_002962 [Carnegiea gigantea]|uniref:Uncharacterized protein n=1 Tax=Carnegiea gigantea TaxID=171969 RepID=A0A9Q1JQR3_9CARY|nr:hypothetical protein Cgig2_002962 [Carnegiea gigantea]